MDQHIDRDANRHAYPGPNQHVDCDANRHAYPEPNQHLDRNANRHAYPGPNQYYYPYSYGNYHPPAGYDTHGDNDSGRDQDAHGCP